MFISAKFWAPLPLQTVRHVVAAAGAAGVAFVVAVDGAGSGFIAEPLASTADDKLLCEIPRNMAHSLRVGWAK